MQLSRSAGGDFDTGSRAGKSTLIRQMMARYKLNPNHCACVNFEDPRLAGALDHRTLEHWSSRSESVTGAYASCTSSSTRSSGCAAGNSGGSDGQLLGSELATSLTKRHWMAEVFPFDLTEAKRLAPTTRHQRALTDFYESFPQAAESLFVTHDDFEAFIEGLE